MNQLNSNRNRLNISRIPIETKRAFTEFADNEFCSDYGMALKWLFDRFAGTLPTVNEEIHARLDELEMRLIELEKNDSSPQPIKSVSGEVIKKR